MRFFSGILWVLPVKGGSWIRYEAVRQAVNPQRQGSYDLVIASERSDARPGHVWRSLGRIPTCGVDLKVGKAMGSFSQKFSHHGF